MKHFLGTRTMPTLNPSLSVEESYQELLQRAATFFRGHYSEAEDPDFDSEEWLDDLTRLRARGLAEKMVRR